MGEILLEVIEGLKISISLFYSIMSYLESFCRQLAKQFYEHSVNIIHSQNLSGLKESR